MINHFIRTALRSIQRNPIYSVINILGFTLGLTASLIIYTWVNDELNADNFHKDADRIYRIVRESRVDGKFVKDAFNSPKLGEALKKDFPQIEDVASINLLNGNAPFAFNNSKIELLYACASENFFSFFSFPVVEGNPERVSEIGKIVISESAAKKLFGNESAIGKELVMLNQWLKEIKDVYTIVGVVKVPSSSHIQFEVALSEKSFMKSRLNGYFVNSSIENGESFVYAKIARNAVISKEVNLHLYNYLTKKVASKSKLLYQPLNDIHLHTDFECRCDHNHGDMTYIVIFSFLAVVILLMGAFNFMVLTTAQAIKRSVEVGIRKASGSARLLLLLQFFIEALINIGIALFIAFVVSRLILPWININIERELLFTLSFNTILIIVFAIIIVALIAASYPALYLSSISPIMAFKGGQTKGSKTNFFRIILVTQLIASITILVCTLVVYLQLGYVNRFDLGLEKKNILIVDTNLWYDVNGFKQEVLKNPNVEGVSMSLLTPNNFSFQMKQDIGFENMNVAEKDKFVVAYTDGDFAKVYKLSIVEGEYFMPVQEDYWNGKYSSEGMPVVINESAKKLLGEKDVIGKRIGDNIIVGVVKDFHFKPLQEKIEPLVISYNPEALTYMSIRINPKNIQGTIKYIKETYERLRANCVFNYEFFDDIIAKGYRKEQQQVSVFIWLSIISVIIAMLGILGLASFSAKRRTKEVGIRKVNGAGIEDIILILSREYALTVLFSFIISTPLAWWVMHRWLDNFAYRISLSWWIFAIAGIVTFVFAMLTISVITYRSARQNPVDCLRYE